MEVSELCGAHREVWYALSTFTNAPPTEGILEKETVDEARVKKSWFMRYFDVRLNSQWPVRRPVGGEVATVSKNREGATRAGKRSAGNCGLGQSSVAVELHEAAIL